MKRSLSFGNHIAGDGKAFSLVSFDKLVLENLKCMDERLVIFLEPFYFLM